MATRLAVDLSPRLGGHTCVPPNRGERSTRMILTNFFRSSAAVIDRYCCSLVVDAGGCRLIRVVCRVRSCSCDGPGGQCVTYKHRLDWSTYLTTSLDVVYVSLDGRGTSARGARFMHQVHRRLGSIEVTDQLATARSDDAGCFQSINQSINQFYFRQRDP